MSFPVLVQCTDPVSAVESLAGCEPLLDSLLQFLLKHWGTLHADLEAFAGHLAATVSSIENEARAVEQRISTHAGVLAERHALQEAEYRTIIATSEEQGERAAERLALQTALAVGASVAMPRLLRARASGD